MNTTTIAPSSASNVAANPAASVPSNTVPSVAERLAQLREETRHLEAQAAEEARLREENERAAKDAATKERMAQLASLPAQFGFGEGITAMRSFLGYMGYHYLRGQTPKAKATRTTKTPPKVTKAKVTRKARTARPLTPEKVDRLLTLIRGGMSVRKATKEIGCTAMSGYSHMKKAGIPLPSLAKAA